MFMPVCGQSLRTPRCSSPLANSPLSRKGAGLPGPFQSFRLVDAFAKGERCNNLTAALRSNHQPINLSNFSHLPPFRTPFQVERSTLFFFSFFPSTTLDTQERFRSMIDISIWKYTHTYARYTMLAPRLIASPLSPVYFRPDDLWWEYAKQSEDSTRVESITPPVSTDRFYINTIKLIERKLD